MKTGGFEPLLRNATIKAIDGISKKVTSAEKAAENTVTRLLKRWNDLDETEKENVAGIVIATATTAVTAIVALKNKRRSVKKAGKSVVKKAVAKLTT